MNELLIRGASHLWTGLPGDAMRHRGGTDIRVRDGLVTAIGTLVPEPGERIVDAGGCVVQTDSSSSTRPMRAATRSACSPSKKRRYGTGTAASQGTSARSMPACMPFSRLWNRWWWGLTQPG